MLNHPVIIIVVTLMITLFFAIQLPHVEFDNNNIRFVPEHDQSRIDSDWLDNTFGSSFFILIGLQKKYGTVFDADLLKQIRDFTSDIEKINIVDKVDSLISTDYITGDADTLTVESLVPDGFSGTPAEIEDLKARVNSWSIYDASLISSDFTATQIYVSLKVDSKDAGDPKLSAQFLQIRDMAHKQFDSSIDVYVTGIPIISSTINEAMEADLKYLVPIVLIVIFLIMYITLRRIYFVIMSVIAVVVATIWTVGAMPLFNIRLSVISTVLPVIMIAVGNSYGLHVIVHYIEKSNKNFGSMTRDEHRAFVIEVTRLVRKPVFLAAITTLASFGSFCVTNIVPMFEFGVFSSFGVIASFVLTITFTPAVLIAAGPKHLAKLSQKKTSSKYVSYNDKIANVFTRISNRKWLILAMSLIVIGISVYGATKLIIDNVFIEYFRDTTEIAKSDRFIRENFGGSKVINVAVQADSSDIILHPDTLCAMDGLSDYLSKQALVGKVLGFSDFIKRTNQVFNIDEPGYETDNMAALLDKAASAGKNMNANKLVWEFKRLTNYEGASYYEIPSDPARYNKSDKDELRQLIANYLVLLSDSTKYSNDSLEPTAIKSTVMMRTTGQLDTGLVTQNIKDYIAANFPKNIKATVGGSAIVETSLNGYVLSNVWGSMIISFVALFLIMSLSYHSVAAGLIGVIPLVALVTAGFAAMGFLGIKLNIATAMIACLSMGIGIDFTIHIMESYKREAVKANFKGDFIFNVYRTNGIAVISDAVSTGLGFAVLVFSQFRTLAEFGFLIMFSLLLSSIVSLFVIPVILNIIKPKFIWDRALNK
jgi:predicted RND superfamily exporter protein